MHVRRKLPLLDLDPDLGLLLPEDRRELCRRELLVEPSRLPRGPWSAGGERPDPEHPGLLLIEGVIAREVVVSDTISTELLGPGDVVRPWSLQAAPAMLQAEIRWSVLTESRVALLDRRFGAQLGDWPEIAVALLDRLNDRAHRLALTQAISQLNRVDRRLLSLFWHLAERWGRITTEGVAIPLTLSHRMLGQLVGARRPTVSTAIGVLGCTAIVRVTLQEYEGVRAGSRCFLVAPGHGAEFDEVRRDGDRYRVVAKPDGPLGELADRTDPRQDRG